MTYNESPIGVFDSGIGGLTVLKVLQAKLPSEDFVYLADTYNLPYGTKSPEQIKKYTYQALSWLQNTAHVKLIVVACHTSSALALEEIQKHFQVPIIGTIYPLIDVVLGNSQYKKIGIIATSASVASKVHERQLKRHGFMGTVFSIACPDFVPLIEASIVDTDAFTTVAQHYLKPFYMESLDTLIYGCTHYPLADNIIQSLLPSTMQYIDPAYAIADVVKIMLDNAFVQKKKVPVINQTQYYCSSDTEQFAAKIARIMHINASVQCVNLMNIRYEENI